MRTILWNCVSELSGCSPILNRLAAISLCAYRIPMRALRIIPLGVFVFFPITAAYCADEPRLEENEQRAALNKMQGKLAPPLMLTNWINSKNLKLDELKGKVVLLEFWATWCPSCIAMIPHHNELAKKYADQGLVFIGICDEDQAQKMPALAKKTGIQYPIAVDIGNATSRRYKCDSTPDFYLIDRKGILRWPDIETDDVEKGIELLLKEK